MWSAGELVLILVLLTAAESVINAIPHPGRRGVMNFCTRLVAYSAGIFIMSFSRLASVATQVIFLLLAAYMFRWFVSAGVAYVRGPQLFEPPRKAELAALAADLTGLAEGRCARVAARVLRKHDARVALLGLVFLAEEKKDVEDFEQIWLDSCDRARATVLDLMEQAEIRGVANALFLAEALCMYETPSVESVLKARNRLTVRGRGGRAWVAHRLEKTGRVRRRAEEYGLPVEHKTKSGEPVRAPMSFLMRIWPPKGLAGLGHPGRGVVLLLSLLAMVAYGGVALAMDRGSGWVFLAIAVLVYMLALLTMSDFRELAVRRREWAESKGDRP
jgi:hypothetical protein